MRHVITEKHESVWIAQRNGRTKDGLDKTEIGLLKMFSLSSDKPFVDNFDEISITPVAISYEYEPCDFLKAVELYISQYQKYIKGEHEDLNSILIGIKQPKGHIHLAITPTILRNELIACDAKEKKNEKLEMLASIIDERINTHRKIYKTNYIAFDILHNSNHFAEFYTQNEKNEFVNYMKTGFDALEIKNDRCSIEEIFLKIYANALEKNDTIVHSAD